MPIASVAPLHLGGSSRGEGGGSFRPESAIGLLAALVLFRFLVHSFFLPAYEGPDEPFHLARVLAFADEPLANALRGAEVPGPLVAAIRAQPCNIGLHRAFGCPLFGAVPGSFDLLSPNLDLPAWPSTINPENNQPPLFYLVPGLMLRALSSLDRHFFSAPDVRLLFTRLYAVGLVALALVWPLRDLARRRSRFFAVVGLLALFLPGAADSLVRAANDAGVFCWAAFALYALEKRAPAALMAGLLALGPLVKLTAFSVVGPVILALYLAGRRAAAITAGLGSLLVFPLQWLRGWGMGGVLESHFERFPIQESLGDILIGLLRSGYAFTKTSLWLGGWSFFRPPPVILLALVGALVVAAACLRWRPIRGRVLPHLVGVTIGGLGFLLFAFANRRFFGDWGGVGGWYLWGWAPWLAVMASDLFSVKPEHWKLVIVCVAIASIGSTIAYYWIAVNVYGI